MQDERESNLRSDKYNYERSFFAKVTPKEGLYIFCRTGPVPPVLRRLPGDPGPPRVSGLGGNGGGVGDDGRRVAAHGDPSAYAGGPHGRNCILLPHVTDITQVFISKEDKE